MAGRGQQTSDEALLRQVQHAKLSASALPASLAAFDAAAVYGIVHASLGRITGSEHAAVLASASDLLPAKLPGSVTERQRVCALAAARLRTLTGYTGDLGYHTLLYPSAGSLRPLLMHLLACLPVGADAHADTLSSASFATAMHKLSGIAAPRRALQPDTSEERSRNSVSLDNSVLPAAPVDDATQRRPGEQDTSASEPAALLDQIAVVRRQIQQGRRDVEALREAQECAATELRIQQQCRQLLPQGEASVREVRLRLAKARQALAEQKQQWADEETALAEQLAATHRRSGGQEHRIAALRVRIRELEEEKAGAQRTNARVEQVVTLAEAAAGQEHADAPTHQVFLARIAEHVRNARRQQDEIERVHQDTQDLRRHVNTMGDQLTREFDHLDNAVYRDATSSATTGMTSVAAAQRFPRAMYHLIVDLYRVFRAIADTVDHSAKLTNQLRDLESQAVKISQNQVDAQVASVRRDLASVQREVQQLMTSSPSS